MSDHQGGMRLMAQEKKYLNQRLSTFELNRILSNASIQYRKSKTNTIYLNELKNYFQNAGIENLKNLPVIPKSHPRKTSARISDAILMSSLEHPGWGCVRLEQALKSQGISVSSPTRSRRARCASSRCPAKRRSPASTRRPSPRRAST